MLTRIVILAVANAFLVGCSVGTAGRVHVDDEVVKDVGISDVDLRAMSRQMAGAIIELPLVQETDGRVYITFLDIVNRTEDPDFDSYNLLSQIRKLLIEYSGGELAFLDTPERVRQAVLAERDKKRAGTVTGSKKAEIPGADYFLTGYAYSMRKADTKGRIQHYHRYSFRLTDAEMDIVVWEDDYEFKKYGRRGTAYR